MSTNAWIRITACICICVLESIALIKGVNGAAFGIACAAIGTIAGSASPAIANIVRKLNPPK